MTRSAGPVLILGGTAEARVIAQKLAAAEIPAVSSLAGRVNAPRALPGEVRIGGFGGKHGLIEYIRSQRIAALIDATHPFAATISVAAAAACAVTCTPLIEFIRPDWRPTVDDRWIRVKDVAQAAAAVADLDREKTVFLTIGRQQLSFFLTDPHRFVIRCLELPTEPLPGNAMLILDSGPFSLGAERNLMLAFDVNVVVTKNSGGPMTEAKLHAARELQLPVITIERPPLPSGVRTTADVDIVLDWVRGHVVL